MDLTVIFDLIETRRKQLKVSKEELCKRAGLSVAGYAKMRRNQNARFVSVVRLVKALDFDVAITVRIL